MKPENIEIEVYKSQKRLDVLYQDHCLHTFPIGIGKFAQGTKHQEGDFKTPEGEYKICVKNPRSKYTLSLGLNYPNKKDALRGLENGQITKRTFQKIVDAIDQNTIPPWKTPLGGEIYIHGHLQERDWSQGCIRLFDQDVRIVYALAQIGTPVRIFP